MRPRPPSNKCIMPASETLEPERVYSGFKVTETVIIHLVRKVTGKHLPAWMKFYNDKNICSRTSQRFKTIYTYTHLLR